VFAVHGDAEDGLEVFEVDVGEDGGDGGVVEARLGFGFEDGLAQFHQFEFEAGFVLPLFAGHVEEECPNVVFLGLGEEAFVEFDAGFFPVDGVTEDLSVGFEFGHIMFLSGCIVADCGGIKQGEKSG